MPANISGFMLYVCFPLPQPNIKRFLSNLLSYFSRSIVRLFFGHLNCYSGINEVPDDLFKPSFINESIDLLVQKKLLR